MGLRSYSNTKYPIRGENVARIDARAVDIAEEQLGRVREHLFEYASPLFVDAAKTPLPPFRAGVHLDVLKPCDSNGFRKRRITLQRNVGR